MTYKVTKEEILKLAAELYEEACCGHLDLKDSVCDQIVGDFFKNKEEIQQIIEQSSMPELRNSYTSGIGGTISSEQTNQVSVEWQNARRLAGVDWETVVNEGHGSDRSVVVGTGTTGGITSGNAFYRTYIGSSNTSSSTETTVQVVDTTTSNGSWSLSDAMHDI